MSARVTRKRARMSSNEDSAEPDAVESVRRHDADFWYSDGNLIVIARDVEFRIYGGLLADHSPVFKDMFSFPQPPAASSSNEEAAPVDPCPVVHISDSPEDFRHILRFYMPRDDASPFLAGEPTFDMISAAIRLGQKYQLSRLHDHALEYLKIYYTSHFDVWVMHAKKHEPPAFEPVHSIGVVNLARLTGEASLLPTALALCCMLDEAIVNGFARADGSREQLTLDDVGLCFVAKDRLVQESVRITLCVFEQVPSGKCKTKPECTWAFRKIVKELQNRTAAFATTDVFAPYHSMLPEIRLCRSCEAMVRERDLRERRAAWDRLSELLGIDEPASSSDEEAGDA